MLIKVSTKAPKGLLAALKKAIEDGQVRTWECDQDGDFTHKAAQWAKHAWLRPETADGVLVFHVLPPKDKQLTAPEAGYYLGHMVETLVTHFDDSFSSVTVA